MEMAWRKLPVRITLGYHLAAHAWLAMPWERRRDTHDESWARYIPGKMERIRKRLVTLSALEYAAGRFGPVRSRSIVIVGLEPYASTLWP